MTFARSSVFALVFVISASSGCGDDGGSTGDTGTMDAGDGGTGDGGFDCVGIPDGTSCAEGFICRFGACSPSECGDGFVDTSAGEACDDENEIPGDGCEPNCMPSCTTNADCDDGDPCNGTETCNTTLDRCQSGAGGDGSMCTREDGEMGVCASGLCAPPGCGNGAVDGMEDCDDGMNGDNTDGCRDDCSFTCTMDIECNDGDTCTGEETCDVTSHTCQDATDLACDDGDACTADSCDPDVGCVATLIDGDGDGYAAPACTSGVMGDDCDDTNSSIYPGAPELCDMLDNDCNGVTDDGTVTVTCLRDSDGDGYGNPGATMEACTCPSGYIPPRADGRTDCQDGIFDVHEGQLGWFATPYCPPRTLCTGTTGFTYDYDCDSRSTQRWTTTGRTSCLSFDCRDGWTGDSVPACGATAEFRDCSTVITPGGIFDCITSSVGPRRQECH